MEKSKTKTSFSMDMEDGWEVNFIENKDGTKIIEIGVTSIPVSAGRTFGINGFYPMYMHFGRDESNERFIHVINTLRPDIRATVAQWPSMVEDNG